MFRLTRSPSTRVTSAPCGRGARAGRRAGRGCPRAPARPRGDRLVDLDHLAGDLVPVEALHDRAPGAAVRSRVARVAEQPVGLPREGGRVAHREERARLPVVERPAERRRGRSRAPARPLAIASTQDDPEALAAGVGRDVEVDRVADARTLSSSLTARGRSRGRAAAGRGRRARRRRRRGRPPAAGTSGPARRSPAAPRAAPRSPLRGSSMRPMKTERRRPSPGQLRQRVRVGEPAAVDAVRDQHRVAAHVVDEGLAGRLAARRSGATTFSSAVCRTGSTPLQRTRPRHRRSGRWRRSARGGPARRGATGSGTPARARAARRSRRRAASAVPARADTGPNASRATEPL